MVGHVVDRVGRTYAVVHDGQFSGAEGCAAVWKIRRDKSIRVS